MTRNGARCLPRPRISSGPSHPPTHPQQLIQNCFAKQKTNSTHPPTHPPTLPNSKLLIIDPRKRLSAEKALQHEWFEAEDEVLVGRELGAAREGIKKFHALR